MEFCADTGPALGAEGPTAECFMAPKGNPKVLVLIPPTPGNPDLIYVSAPLPILNVSYRWKIIIHAFCVFSHIFVFI